MKFYAMDIEVIKEDGKPVIYISTHDAMEDTRYGVTMSPEQAVIVAEELNRISAELI